MRRKPELLLSPEHRRIIWHLRAKGATSRTRLADQLGIHNGAMTRLARELITLGLVEEQEQPQDGSRGRPTVPLVVSPRGGYTAGATVHPGWIELVLVDFTGEVIARHSEPFSSDAPRAFMLAIEEKLRRLIAERNLITSRFLGLGIGVAGPMMMGSAKWQTVEWLRGWREVDLPDYFEDYLDLPVWVENNATLAGLAEYYDCGLIHSRHSALIFFIGHGVGGGLIYGGEFLRGEYGNAGDVGRLYPSDAPRPSGLDLLATLNRAGADIHSLLDIEQHLESHAGLIAQWVERAAGQLDPAAHAGVALLDPGAVILSGALPLPVLAALGERLARTDWVAGKDWLARPSFHVTRLGSWAVSIGAALLPVHRLLSDTPD